MLVLAILKLLFAIASCVLYFIAAKQNLPHCPKVGEKIEAKTMEDFWAYMRKTSKINKYAALTLAVTLAFEVVQLILRCGQ